MQMAWSSSRFESKCSQLLSWIKTWKTSVEVIASADPETTPDSSDLVADLKVYM